MDSAADIKWSVVAPTTNREDDDQENNQAAILDELDEWDNMQEQRYADGQSMRRVEELDLKNEANSWL